MPASCLNNILLYSFKWAHQYLDFSLLGLNTALPYLTFPGLWPSWTRVNWLTAADKQSFHSPSGTALPGLGMSLACDWSAPEHFPSASPPQPASWILSNSLILVYNKKNSLSPQHTCPRQDTRNCRDLCCLLHFDSAMRQHPHYISYIIIKTAT